MQCILRNCTIPLLILCALTTRAQSLPHPDASQATDSAQAPVLLTAPTRSSDDWNRLRELAHQEEINVWASRNRHVRCLFSGATDDYLFCEPRYPYQGSGEYRFDRADVDKVRLEQGERNFKRTIELSALAGAGTGAALPSSNSGDRVLGALAGGLAGAFAGIIIAGPVALLTPGHLVYQRPHTRKKVASAHIPTEDSQQQVQKVRP